MASKDKPRVFYDTEFIETVHTDWNNNRTSGSIELISIGMIGTTPMGEEFSYYAVREEAPLSEIYHNKFLRENILPHLPIKEADSGANSIDRTNPCVKPQWVIRNEVREFIRALSPDTSDRNSIELWADYAAHDHVVLSWLFGTMMDLPPFVPMFTHDVQAFHSLTGAPEALLRPATLGTEHNALNDAIQCKERYEAIKTWAIAQLHNVNSADPFVEPEEDPEGPALNTFPKATNNDW
jgi:hypothetical protein